VRAKLTWTLDEKIEACRLLTVELSKKAGITKALHEKINNAADSEERYYLKSLFECQLYQLMIGLNILTKDVRSEIKIETIISDFEKKYGSKLKQAGYEKDVETELHYASELKDSIDTWNNIRNQYAAHKDVRPIKDWNVDIDHVSIYICSVQNIINTMLKTIAVDQAYLDNTVSTTSYVVSTAINLEEESYKSVLLKLKWHK